MKSGTPSFCKRVTRSQTKNLAGGKTDSPSFIYDFDSTLSGHKMIKTKQFLTSTPKSRPRHATSTPKPIKQAGKQLQFPDLNMSEIAW